MRLRPNNFWYRLIGVLTCAGAAFLLLRPDQAVPFDILDFSEILPLLNASDDPGDRFVNLSRYYAGHGRANLIPYALMSAKWELFGDQTLGWQWARYGVVVSILLLTYALLRRLGTTVGGALAGTSVLLVAPAAVRAWIRVTTAEPLGIFFLLILCHTILPVDRFSAEKRRWFVAGCMVVGIVLTKEMLAATLVLPVAILCLTNRKSDQAQVLIPRVALTFAAAAGALALAALLPMAGLVIRAPANAFSAQFGATTRPVGDAIAAWLFTLIPFDPSTAVPRTLVGAALAIYLLLIGVGWVFRISRTRERRRDLGWLLFAVLFPLIGAAIYAPWPLFHPYYAAPFLIGTVMLIAFGQDAMFQAGRRWGIAAAAVWTLLAFTAFADGIGVARRTAAAQRVHLRLIERLHAFTDVDSVIVASDAQPPQSWQSLGSTLQRYGLAVGSATPPILDRPCRGIGEMLHDRASVVVVRYATLCPGGVDPTPIVERYRRFHPGTFAVVQDSVRVDIERLAGPGR